MQKNIFCVDLQDVFWYNSTVVGSDDMSDGKNDNKLDYVELAKAYSMVFQLGLSMMVPIGLCIFIGYKLDKWLGTRYIVIIFIFIGMAAGMKSAYTITKGFYQKDLEKEKKQREYFDSLYKHSRSVDEKETDNDNKNEIENEDDE